MLVGVYLFFLTSRIIFNTPSDNPDTELRTPITMGNHTVEIASKEFFSDRNLLEVDLMINKKGTSLPPDLKVKVKEKSDTDVEYKTDVKKITDEYYVVFVQDLPKKWKSVSLEVGDKNDESNSTISMNKKLYVGSQKVSTSEVFIKQKVDYYKAKHIDILMSDANKLIKNEDKNINKADSNISKFEENIVTLKSDLEFQTESEKVETQTEIKSNESQIASLKKEILDREKVKKELKDKIKKLEEKRATLVY